jgi:hypothetical protein
VAVTLLHLFQTSLARFPSLPSLHSLMGPLSSFLRVLKFATPRTAEASKGQLAPTNSFLHRISRRYDREDMIEQSPHKP